MCVKPFDPSQPYEQSLHKHRTFGNALGIDNEVTLMLLLPTFLVAKARLTLCLVSLGCLSTAAWSTMTEPYANYTVTGQDTVATMSRSLLTDPAKWADLLKLNGLAGAPQAGQVLQVPKSLLNFNSQPRIAQPGKVISTVGDVKVAGVAVLAGAEVPEGARLETGANGSAVVQLGDGSRVQLMPKTLAEVTSQHSYALRDPSTSASTTWFSGAIRLVAGVLDTLANKQANRATPLVVTTPTSVVGVRGTHFRVAYEDPNSGSARAEVLEGKVQNDNPAQNASVALNTGYGAAVKPQDREINAVALLPAMASAALPKEILRIVGQNNEPVQANWYVGSVAGASGYRSQFASDEKFAALEGDFKSPSNALNVTALLDGKYFARVRGVDGAGIEGYDAVQLVEIKTAAQQPGAVWPKELPQRINAEYVRNGVVLRLNQKSTDSPNNLLVQIARDPAFTQGVITAPLGLDGTAILRNVPANQRSFVRFAGTSPQGQTSSSGVFAIDLPRNWGSAVTNLPVALQSIK